MTGLSWLTVASPEEPAGTELQLARNNNPAAVFFTDDVKGDYERINARSAKFTMPPTDVTYATPALQPTVWYGASSARARNT